MTATRRPDSYGVGKTLLLTLVVLPLFAAPIYLLGQGIADSLDDDATDGVLGLGLMLGVAGPALTSLFVARGWGGLPWIATLALGVGSGFVSLIVLLGAFIAFCTATTCVA